MQDSNVLIHEFISKLYTVDEKCMYIGSYAYCLKKQYTLSKLPPSMLSRTQNRKEIINDMEKLWKDFFASIPYEEVEECLKQLEERINYMHTSVSEEKWLVEKQDYIYIQYVTPFHIAAWCGYLEWIESIQLNFNSVWKEYIGYYDLLGNLPFHCCFFNFDSWQDSISSSLPLTSLFDTTLNVINALGLTPLHIAVINNQANGVLYLREQDIDLTLPVHFFSSDKLTDLFDSIDVIRDICQFIPSSEPTRKHSNNDSWRCSSCSSVYGSLCSYENSFDDRFGIQENSLHSNSLLHTSSSSLQSLHYELEGYSALHLALISDSPFCAFLLLESVDDLFNSMKSTLKPLEVISLSSYSLFSYFNSSQLQILFTLLPKEWHSFTTPTQDLLQSTLLNGIICKNYSSLIRILGSKINLDASYFSILFSPLHIACVLLDEVLIRLFLGYGANPRKLTASQDTCLHLVLKSQSKYQEKTTKANLLSLLIMAGCDSKQPDGEGYPPLYYAVKMNDYASVKVLLAYGSDPTIWTGIPTGRNAFIEAIIHSNEKIIRLIFKYFPGLLNIPDGFGHYPLYYLVKQQSLGILVYLLNYTPPLTEKAISDLESAFHILNEKVSYSLLTCVKKQLCYINHTCTNLNRYRLNFLLPNQFVEKCMHCGKKFSIITLKRHCRRCGQILCSNCCQDDYDKTKDHICNECRLYNVKESSQLYTLQQFEDNIKSYLVKNLTT